jgi:hypothetical protein
MPGRAREEVSIDLEALGDFDPNPSTTEALEEVTTGEPLGVPAGTRSVRLFATDGFDEWSGVGELSGTDVLDVSLWPVTSACTLFEAGDGYPSAVTGQAVGTGPGGSLLVFGGGESTSSATSGLFGNVDQGRIMRTGLDPRNRRSGARATRFGDGILVSGGIDPLREGLALGSAESLDVVEGRFEAPEIELSTPRADHGAVVLESGDTLLVGGRDDSGRALRTVEVLSPETRRYRIADLTDLGVGRIGPTVTKLTDGTVVVAGGRDEAGNALDGIEWLSADAYRIVRTLQSIEGGGPAVVGRAFAPMPEGGFLAAGGCELRAPSDPERVPCQASCGPGNGCPATSAVWVDDQGSATRLDEAVRSPAPIPSLISGEEGRPWLATGDPQGPRLLRFDPWRGRFEPPDVAPSRVPSASATVVAVDSGALVWLEPAGEPGVYGFRHATRNAFASDVAPLVLTGSDHLAPSRAPDERLSLEPGALRIDDPDVVVFVTETRYESLRLVVIRDQGPPPVVRLGAFVAGGGDCLWPPSSDADSEFRLVRNGSSVELVVGERTVTCRGPDDPISVGISTPGGELVVRELRVRRTAEP